MALFFFISALLVPGSLARKGAPAFLRDRFKRLGIPFIIYALAAGPALGAAATALGPRRDYVYGVDANVAWFLVWLLVFTCAAVWAASAPPPLPPPRARPSLLVMVCAGALCGVLQAAQMAFAPAFPYMPISFGSLPFDVLFFFAGLEAARGEWLREPFGVGEVRAARIVAAALALTAVAWLSAVERAGGGSLFLSVNACGAPSSKGPLGADALPLLFTFATGAGVFAVCVSVALLDGFRSWSGDAAPGPARAWLAAHSFAAYLVHPFVVLPLTGGFIAVAVRDGSGSWDEYRNSSACLGTRGGADWLLGGFLCLTAASLALTYPLAAAVRALPGAREIL
jgi:hypothetical protein